MSDQSPSFWHPLRNLQIFREQSRLRKAAEEELSQEKKNRKKRAVEKRLEEYRREERRALLMLLGQGTLVAGLTGSGLLLRQSVSHSGVESALDEPNKPVKKEEKERQPLTTLLPQMDILPDEKLAFSKPEQFTMSDEVFQGVMKTLVPKIKRYLREEFERRMPVQRTIPRVLIMELIQLVQSVHPDFASFFQDFFQRWNSSLDVFNQELNRLLNPAGYHFIHFQGESGKTHLNLMEITDTQTIRVQHQLCDPFDIPLIELHSQDIMESNEYGHRMGVYQPLSGAIEVFPEKIAANFDDAMRQAKAHPEYPRFSMPYDREEVLEKYRNEVVYHEVTHAVIHHLFPEISQYPMSEGIIKGVRFQMPLQEEGPKADLSGDYSFTQFNELCGVAAQLACTEIDMPLIQVQFLRDYRDKDPRGSYYLVYRALPAATVNLAPDGEAMGNHLKADTIKKFEQTGIVDVNHVKALISWSPYSREHTQKTGEVLFDLAFRTLQQLAPQFRKR